MCIRDRSNRCRMPIIPTDLFPRELAEITGTAYSRITISFDVICLLTRAGLTFFGLGRIMGLGVGTVLAAFTMGKCIGLIGGWMDRRVSFVSILSRRQAAVAEEGCTMRFPTMISPIQIGSVTVPNRFVVPPMANNFSDPDGCLSQRSLAYYAARARGGFGLITIESAVVYEQAKGGLLYTS